MSILENLEERITSCFLDSQSWQFTVLLSPSAAHSHLPSSPTKSSMTTAFKPLFLSPRLTGEILPFVETIKKHFTNGDFQPLLSVMLVHYLYRSIDEKYNFT